MSQRRKRKKWTGIEEEEESGNRNAKTKARAKERSTNALFVRRGSESYADLLKEVKQEICSTNLEIKIDAIRETKNGDLLVAVDKTEANFEKIKEALRSKLGQDKVRSKERLDAVTTKEDTHAALMKAVRERVSDPNDIEVSNMRLAYGNCQPATIKVSKKATDVLLQ